MGSSRQGNMMDKKYYYSDRIIPHESDETCSDTNPPLINIDTDIDQVVLSDTIVLLVLILKPL